MEIQMWIILAYYYLIGSKVNNICSTNQVGTVQFCFFDDKWVTNSDMIRTTVMRKALLKSYRIFLFKYVAR